MLDTNPHLRIKSVCFGARPISSGMEKQQSRRLDYKRHACQSLREVLQLKLQQRRTREELVSQGIMPPLKSPAAFHEQRRSLERARTEDYLKRKIRSRPERAELVRMHILEETSAEPSLQAKQLQLKRARLADDLNDKISHRPGPMELIHKNILPVHSSLKQVLIETEFSRAIGENSSFDEDSSDALSPDQPANQDSPLRSTPLPSPPNRLANHNPSPTEFLLQAPPPPPPPPLPMVSVRSPSQKMTNGTTAQRHTSGLTNGTTAQRHTPGLAKARTTPDRPSPRPKKAKDTKPKVKKLKYHQYIPPDQKADRDREQREPPQLDSTYAKILQQQQLFLQLQIISQQQQQHYNYHTILPAPPKPPTTEQQQPSATSTASTTTTGPSPSSRSAPHNTSTSSSNQSGSSRQASSQPGAGAKPGSLPPNLDELKVAELKQELKLRCLPVSGTKSDLLERLRNYQEQQHGAPSSSSTGPTGGAVVVTTTGGGLKGSAAAQLQFQPLLQHRPCNPSPILAAGAPVLHQSGDGGVLLHQSGDGGVLLATFPFVTALGKTLQGGGGTRPQVMHFGSASSTPPVSPAPSERSLVGTSPNQASCNGDAFGEMVSAPLTQLSLQHSPPLPQHSLLAAVKEEETTSIASRLAPCRFSSSQQPPQRLLLDKDRLLQEKDKQIEELTRMLLQKQRLVETLRLQLEMGSKQAAGTMTTGGAKETLLQPPPEGAVVRVKEEPPDIVPADAYHCCLSPPPPPWRPSASP